MLFECFDTQAIGNLQVARDCGARFVIIGTEVPGKTAFNEGYRSDMEARQQIFPHAACLAEALWVLAPDPLGWYATLGVPTAKIELGYSRALVEESAVQPTYDFCFYGIMTDYRHRVLKRFEAAGLNVVVTPHHATPVVRNAVIQSARAVLEIGSYENSRLISSSRCATSLHAGRPVFCEPRDASVDGPWRGIVTVATSDAEMFAEARSLVSDWQGCYSRQMVKFSGLLDAERCLGTALALLK